MALVDEIGPLSKPVNEFCSRHFEVMAVGAHSPLESDPVADFVDMNECERMDVYLEELNWEYRKLLMDEWVAGRGSK